MATVIMTVIPHVLIMDTIMIAMIAVVIIIAIRRAILASMLSRRVGGGGGIIRVETRKLDWKGWGVARTQMPCLPT